MATISAHEYMKGAAMKKLVVDGLCPADLAKSVPAKLVNRKKADSLISRDALTAHLQALLARRDDAQAPARDACRDFVKWFFNEWKKTEMELAAGGSMAQLPLHQYHKPCKPCADRRWVDCDKAERKPGDLDPCNCCMHYAMDAPCVPDLRPWNLILLQYPKSNGTLAQPKPRTAGKEKFKRGPFYDWQGQKPGPVLSFPPELTRSPVHSLQQQASSLDPRERQRDINQIDETVSKTATGVAISEDFYLFLTLKKSQKEAREQFIERTSYSGRVGVRTDGSVTMTKDYFDLLIRVSQKETTSPWQESAIGPSRQGMRDQADRDSLRPTSGYPMPPPPPPQRPPPPVYRQDNDQEKAVKRKLEDAEILDPDEEAMLADVRAAKARRGVS